MRFSLAEARAPRFEIDLTGSGDGARTISLTDLIDVTLELESGGGRTRIRSLRGVSAVLDQLEWPLPRGGRVTASSRGALSAVAIELDTTSSGAGPSATGRGAVGRVEAGAVTLELPGGQRLAVDVGARALGVEHSPERVGHVTAERVDLNNLQTSLAGWLVRLSSAVLERPRVDWRGDGELLIGASAVRLGDLAVTGDGVTLEIDRVELPEGIRTSGDTLVLPHLVVPEIRIAVDDLMALIRRPAEEAAASPEEPGAAGRPPSAPPERPPTVPPEAPTSAPAARPPTGRPPAGRPFDFGFLDRLTGRLDVDLTMDLTIPVLGRRKATHHFRVPIVAGMINYRELERDLANLEDAFIDIEVRGHALVLERTIPLIPGLEKPLIFWDLEADELELAKKRLVRLRTLPRLRLAPRVEKSDKPSGLAVRRLLFDDVDIALALAPPEEGQEDSIARASAAELRVGGRVDHDIERAGAPTELTLAAERLAAGPAELAVRGAEVELEAVAIGSVPEAAVEMHGLLPRGARLVLRDLELRNLRVQLGARAP